MKYCSNTKLLRKCHFYTIIIFCINYVYLQRMVYDEKVSYYIDKYGIFHRILRRSEHSFASQNILEQVNPKSCSTWLRIIMMFWNTRVLKAALRFGVAAVVMNQYERLGFALLLLCFAL